MSSKKNVVEIQIQNNIISKGNSTLSHLIDVSAQVIHFNNKDVPVDIKDVINKEGDQDVIIHYVVFDLCNLDSDSVIDLKITALDGEAKGFVTAEIADISPFSIECIDKASETFLPREQHGACETWDGSIWVFGGIRNVGKKEIVLDDIMTYDSKLKQWRTVKPSKNAEPIGRYGHSMM